MAFTRRFKKTHSVRLQRTCFRAIEMVLLYFERAYSKRCSFLNNVALCYFKSTLRMLHA